MTKHICLIIISFHIQNLCAQKNTFHLGFHAGGNLSNFLNSEAPHKMNIDNYDGVKDRLYVPNSQIDPFISYETGLVKDVRKGYTFALSAEYFFAQHWTLKLNINYEQKGFDMQYFNHESSVYPYFGEINTRHKEQTYNLRIKNTYITAPLVLRKHLGKAFYLQGGVYGGLLLSSHVEKYFEKKESSEIQGQLQSYSSQRYNYNVQGSEEQQTANWDFGFVAGWDIKCL
jgi:hypothetical protein